MEVFIRPPNYHRLIVSEQCYSSSTARFIDYIHLSFEAISLMIFIPEFIPLFSESYGRFDYFVSASSLTSKFQAQMDLIFCSTTAARLLKHFYCFRFILFLSAVGDSALDAVMGHFFYGLIRLRIFGVVRHWRNMWINRIYTEEDEKERFVTRVLFPISPSIHTYEKIKVSLPRFSSLS